MNRSGFEETENEELMNKDARIEQEEKHYSKCF